MSHMEGTPGVFRLVSTFSLSPFSFCVLWLQYISCMLNPSESLTRGWSWGPQQSGRNLLQGQSEEAVAKPCARSQENRGVCSREVRKGAHG